MSTRREKVSDQIVEEVSRLLLRDLRDPRIGFVTITGAWVSPDLRVVRVFVSVMGDARSKEDSIQALNSASGFIQRSLFKRLRLRNSPTLTFHLDDSLDRGARIEQVLSAIHEGADRAPEEEE